MLVAIKTEQNKQLNRYRHNTVLLQLLVRTDPNTSYGKLERSHVHKIYSFLGKQGLSIYILHEHGTMLNLKEFSLQCTTKKML